MYTASVCLTGAGSSIVHLRASDFCTGCFGLVLVSSEDSIRHIACSHTVVGLDRCKNCGVSLPLLINVQIPCAHESSTI